MKKLLLFPALVFAFNVLLAQDDDLPPPTSRPSTESSQTTPDGSSFKGFKKHKKVDFSKFIIEPCFNFAFSPGRVDAGISPYVGYLVWSPDQTNSRRGNSDIKPGLYAGGGITYFYTGFPNAEVVDNLGRTWPIKANFHTYGGGVFLQYNIWRGFFARAKFEVLHRNMSDINTAPLPKNPNNINDGFYFNRVQTTIPDLLVGVGYNLLQSKNFFFPLLVSYNLLDGVTNKTYAVYPNAWVIQLGYVTIF